MGLRPTTKRGAFGSTWWAGRWTAALERLVNEGRLARGRTYARGGRVLALDVAADGVQARVQGSRPSPYQVSIGLRSLSDAAWESVLDALAAQAIYAARLLSGEMPEDVETVFASAGAHLLPAEAGDLQTSCSCPDWANPCKHVAAVYYLLGERFDADPFLLFLLRGRGREELLAALRARRAPTASEEPATSDAAPEPARSASRPEASVPSTDLVRYWAAGADEGPLALTFAPPESDALAAKQLGPPPFVADQAAWAARLEPVYRAISRHARGLALED